MHLDPPVQLASIIFSRKKWMQEFKLPHARRLEDSLCGATALVVVENSSTGQHALLQLADVHRAAQLRSGSYLWRGTLVASPEAFPALRTGCTIDFQPDLHMLTSIAPEPPVVAAKPNLAAQFEQKRVQRAKEARQRAMAKLLQPAEETPPEPSPKLPPPNALRRLSTPQPACRRARTA